MTTPAAQLSAALEAELARAYELRRRLHQEPRLSGEEGDTLELILGELAGLPVARVAGGALVRVGSGAGPAIGLRAEMDGLPIVEQTTVPWRAENGAMHACGHDVHMAAAVAVARAVRSVADAAPLVLALQPREERLPSGAADLIESDALRGHDIRAFVGVHVHPRISRGEVAANPGAVNAAADDVYITLHGRPGHGAYPHTTADPVVAAASLVGALQHLVSRQVDPMHPTVLTIGSIHGGDSPNVVPAQVLLSGTLRTFDADDRDRLGTAIHTVAESVATVHGCKAEVSVNRGEPVLHNDPRLTWAAHPWLERAGLHPTAELKSCGADDFSYYCSRYPAMMIFLGVGTGDPDQPGLHHPRFLPADEDLAAVARAMLAGYLGACASHLTDDDPVLPETHP